MMKYATGMTGALAAMTLAGCVAVDVTDSTPDAPAAMTAAEARAIVEARNGDFEKLFAADDAAGLATQMYTAGGRLVPPDAPDMVGPEAIAAYWTGALGVIETVDLATVEAVPAGAGHIAERTHVTLYGADGSVMGAGKAVILWTQEDGTWKMQWDSWNNGPVE
ncbi:YybH family protein [Hyphomonas johnsonii]|uniref:Uncharacterized protein n=1 Tax=Hyphomonas johnsonii MHS-2 TaxID=1280950 RepID=A0A059FP63_9PROT|nr:DUF4440 domain-containing protein [Hyphomonas johnsonii]KCZ92316.1 hypothetical protein HJO_09784 [Hyphomonas johnsonii MHS-2]